MMKNRGEKTRRAARRFASFGRGLCRVVFWGYVATTVFASLGVVASENDERFLWREVENGVELVQYYDMKAFEVVIPSEVNGKPVTSIGENAFFGCFSLSSLVVAEGNRFFRSVDGVLFTADGKTLVCYPAGKKATEYAVPEGVTSIGDVAFYGCKSLASITFPASVEGVGFSAFAECAPGLVLRAPAGAFMEKYKLPKVKKVK